VQITVRKTLIGLFIVGVVGAILFPFAIFIIGLAVAPPPPMPAQQPVPPLLAEAMWARANGGRATALTPISPISMAQFAGCVALEDWKDTTPGDARRVAACRDYMPAIQGLEYLAGQQMRDAGLKSGFREGLGRFSTTVWLSRSWTRENVLNTLAARADFGFGYHGVDAAARGYFGKPADRLALHEAALIAGFTAENYIDPWCWPGRASELRNRILTRMRENEAIDEPAYREALAAPLGVVPRPGDRPPCDS
jgi:Transglycosylase